jgi:hypothetical protein
MGEVTVLASYIKRSGKVGGEGIESEQGAWDTGASAGGDR